MITPLRREYLRGREEAVREAQARIERLVKSVLDGPPQDIRDQLRVYDPIAMAHATASALGERCMASLEEML